jgi:hypothetical protein
MMNKNTKSTAVSLILGASLSFMSSVFLVLYLSPLLHLSVIYISLIGFLMVVFIIYIAARRVNRIEYCKLNISKDQDIADRIRGISYSLSKSASELAEMQEQLEKRIAFVEDLTEKAKHAEKIASLNGEQANAIQNLLDIIIRNEGRKGFVQSIVFNTIFFILGIIITLFIRD